MNVSAGYFIFNTIHLINNSTDLIVDDSTELPDATTISSARPPPPHPSIGAIDPQAILESILMGFPEYRLASSLNKYGYMTEVVVGCVANILALIVMMRLRHLPICNYMAALALADICVLLGPCLVRWLVTQNLDPQAHSTTICRLINFLIYWCFSLSAWLLVAMTVDRYIAITFPLRAIRLSTPHRARIVIVIIMIVMALINVHFFMTLVVEKQVSTRPNVCVAYNQFQYFFNEVWPWIDAAVYSFLPFLFLIVFNFLIIKNHRKSVLRYSQMKGSKNRDISAAKERVSRKLTITLLTVAFTFMAMTAPKVILMIIRPKVFNFKLTPTTNDYGILAKYMLTSSLVNLLMFCNHCINFFLYVLTGHKFREQLIFMLTNCGKRRLRRIQAAPADFSSTEMNSASVRQNKSFSREDSLPVDGMHSSETAGQPIKPDLIPDIEELTPEYDLTSVSASKKSEVKSKTSSGLDNHAFRDDESWLPSPKQ